MSTVLTLKQAQDWIINDANILVLKNLRILDMLDVYMKEGATTFVNTLDNDLIKVSPESLANHEEASPEVCPFVDCCKIASATLTSRLDERINALKQPIIAIKLDRTTGSSMQLLCDNVLTAITTLKNTVIADTLNDGSVKLPFNQRPIPVSDEILYSFMIEHPVKTSVIRDNDGVITLNNTEFNTKLTNLLQKQQDYNARISTSYYTFEESL